MGVRIWRTLALFSGVFIAANAAGQAAYERFECLIEPHAVIDLSTREDGVIDTVLVKRGDRVESGQLVAMLEAGVERATVDLVRARTQMDAELAERRADVALAHRELRRIEKRFETKEVSLIEQKQAATEAARARLKLRQTEHRQKLAQLELAWARKALQRRALVSPVRGMIVELLRFPGESVENATIMRIAAVDPLNVEVIMPISHYGAIDVGRRAEIEPMYPGAEAQIAMVSVVDSVIDSASDSFGVRLELPNPQYAIPAGVRCNIRFIATSVN